MTLDDGLVNTATTSGTPSDDNGDEIPDLEPPTDDDDASVDVEDDGVGDDDDDEPEVLDDDLEVDINIEKVVYEGHTSGSGCATAGEEVYAEIGTPITYCFFVKNTGTVHLANVVIDDPTLGITQADMTLLSGNPAMLAPDATVVWYYETEIVDNITNIASTTGTPSEPDGTEIPAEPPTDSDDASVGEEEVLGQELPSTGVDTDIISFLGAASMLAGLILIGAQRRRRFGVASLAQSWSATPHVWKGHSTAPSRERATARRRRLRR